MEEHHPVVDATHHGLAFGGADHIGLVEDRRSSIFAVLEDEPVAVIVRKVASALK